MYKKIVYAFAAFSMLSIAAICYHVISQKPPAEQQQMDFTTEAYVPGVTDTMLGGGGSCTMIDEWFYGGHKWYYFSIGGCDFVAITQIGVSPIITGGGGGSADTLSRSNDTIFYANSYVDLSDMRTSVSTPSPGTYNIDVGGSSYPISTGPSSQANNLLAAGSDGKPYLPLDSVPGSAGGGGCEIFTFSSSGTFTIPDSAVVVEVHLIGGGGGGGGGASRSSSFDRDGGTGGSGGQHVWYSYSADDLGGSGTNISITIGAGGTGGTGESAQDAGDATNGSDGSSSTFGNYLIAYNGKGGGKGTTASNTASAVSFGGFSSGVGGYGGWYGAGAISGEAGGTSSYAAAGGGGGRHAAGGSAGIGGVGLKSAYNSRTGPAAGVSATAGTFDGGGGGNASGNGGNGSRGGGGGGGGGSSSVGGNGGAGGNGYCWIYVYKD